MFCVLLVFPNQLYEHEIYEKVIKSEKIDAIYICEDPIYFYDPIHRPVRPNKIKIAYMRACMRFFYEKISKLHNHVKYFDYAYMMAYNYSFVPKNSHVICFDVTDHGLQKKLENVIHRTIESPNFILQHSDMATYRQQHPHSSRHESFYKFVKNKLDIFTDIPNMDKYNRKPILNKFVLQQEQSYKTKSTSRYFEEAMTYAKKDIFASHHGSPTLVHLYPISSQQAYESFHRFLDINLEKFGTYQDAILQEQYKLHHSFISAALNIGLLDPRNLVKIFLEHIKKSKKELPLNSIEGFIRQLIGWREYMRYLYVYDYDVMIKSNLPKNRKMIPQSWYTATTNIYPLDNEIKKALKYGYAHHIIRLMVFLNLAIICGYHPSSIYAWFMEVVSIDAYDWVMIPNIYAMGYFYSKAMSRPYLSTSNYIVKMSDYKKDGLWDKQWDNIYHIFVSSKPHEYVFYYKR